MGAEVFANEQSRGDLRHQGLSNVTSDAADEMERAESRIAMGDFATAKVNEIKMRIGKASSAVSDLDSSVAWCVVSSLGKKSTRNHSGGRDCWIVPKRPPDHATATELRDHARQPWAVGHWQQLPPPFPMTPMIQR